MTETDTKDETGMTQFADLEELWAYMTQMQPKEIEEADPHMASQIRSRISLAAEGVTSGKIAVEDAGANISSDYKHTFTIDWIGTFQELLSGDTDFAYYFREGYWADGDLEYQDRPIPEGEIPKVLEHFREYPSMF